MQASSAMRYAGAALVAGALALAFVGGGARSAQGQVSLSEGGEAGFVVSHIEYALGRDAAQSGACPNGMTSGYQNMGDVFVNQPQLQRQEGELEDAYLGRVFRAALTDPSVQNLCANPELGRPDPNFRTVSAPNVQVYGIDLDGQVSRRGGAPAPGTCSHDDFRGMSGERGVDNQFYRVVGCSNSFQSTGQSNGYATEMLTGAWGILITVKGVDDLRNDPDVEVGIYSNADPIQLSPTREPLPNATYAMEQDPRFRATTRGRIVNGVLTSDPVDVRFRKVTNSIRLERPLRDARVQMTFTADGGLDGYLAGYTPVDDMYDLQYGFRNGTDGAGQPAQQRLRYISSIGAANVLGHTCQGAYYALREQADGHRDPETGHCTSISTQYRIRAIPAFVVDAATESVNSDLDR